jgi:hypothetical protein
MCCLPNKLYHNLNESNLLFSISLGTFWTQNLFYKKYFTKNNTKLLEEKLLFYKDTIYTKSTKSSKYTNPNKK